jgi:hypothetical protein
MQIVSPVPQVTYPTDGRILRDMHWQEPICSGRDFGSRVP